MYIDEYPRETTFESFHPEEEVMRVLEDWELQSRRSSRKGSKMSLTSSLKRKFGSLGSLTSSKRAALMEMGVITGAFGDMGEGKHGVKPDKPKKEKPKVKEKL